MTERFLKINKGGRRRVALKYCGGCDPVFDRVAYFRKIESLSANDIEWVTLDDPDYEAVLLIEGCDMACAEKSIGSVICDRIISVRRDDSEPGDILNKLLSREEKNED